LDGAGDRRAISGQARLARSSNAAQRTQWGALLIQGPTVKTTGGYRSTKQREHAAPPRDESPVLVPLCGPGARAQSAVPGSRSGCAGEVTKADGVLHAARQRHA